ncbi:hypothetical protein OESDEN_03808 [Oesophagostomum dentatum]|uniref:Mos1 transposase HTH domain-containing protein n=1 Tax=Oesophagostomum dentatum TaxID=61180 RepID=A0A0B1TK94_OESDE|nr:hypothetical protein OESDEN_03808 [Oesophagostomum dentatum]
MKVAFVPDRKHIRHVILFFFNFGCYIKEAKRRMKHVYTNDLLHCNPIEIWYFRFKKGDDSLEEEEERSGRATKMDLELLKQTVNQDPFQRCELAEPPDYGDEKWVSFSNVHRKAQWVGIGEQAQDVPNQDLHPKKVMVESPIGNYWMTELPS